MRIHELRATAFGPFPDEVSVDFDALTAQGLFLIHGPTGAGKTSLLDAICFALFADVPGMRDRRGVVSDHAAPGTVPSVELEFTCGTRRFRLHRQPAHTRPKKRGTGTIEAPATVSLSELRDGEWGVLSTRNDETAEVLDDVIGMGKEQFAKVAMLPQGEFAAFLTAKDEDRRALLEKLFDITRFADVEDWLVAQRRASETEVGALQSAIDTDLARLADVMAASGVEATHEGAETDHGTSTSVDADARSAPSLDDNPGASACDAQPHSAPSLGDQSGTSAGGGTPALDPRSPEAIRTRLAETGASLDAHLSAAMVALEMASADDAAASGAAERTRATMVLRERGLAARTTLGELEAAQDSVDEARARVDVARRAASVRGHLDAIGRARADVDASAARHRAAIRRVEELTGQSSSVLGDDAEPSALGAPTPAPETSEEPSADRRDNPRRTTDHRADAAAALVAALACHDDTLRELQRLATVRSRRLHDSQGLADALTAATDVLDRADDDRAGAEAQVRATEQALADATDAEAAIAAADLLARSAGERRQLGARLLEVSAALPELAQAAAEARSAAQDARDHEQDLVGRRLAQMAAELAEGLIDGTSCPVCGSHEHPEPATSADRVSRDEIEEARRVHASLVQAQHAAEEHATTARARVAEALTTLDASTVEEVDLTGLESAEKAAATRVSELTARARRRSAAEKAVDAARTALRSLDVRVQKAHREVARVSGLVEQAQQAEADDLASARDRWASHAACPCLASARPGPETVDATGGDPLGGIADLVDVHERLSAAASTWLDRTRELAVAVEHLASSTAAGEQACAEAGFDSVAAAAGAVMATGELERLGDLVRDHDRAASSARAVLDDDSVQGALAGDPPDLDEVTERARQARAALLTAQSEQARATGARAAFTTVRSSLVRGLDAAGPALERHHRIKELADTFTGGGLNNTLRMRLTSYVLAARLDKVAQLANERLRVMGGGRYALEHTDRLAARGARSGLGLRVLDQWTGVSRETSTLSGGEAFMASLALALGLADAVREESGGFDLGTLFVDEGFGTLDEESLEEVVSVLDGLREGGRAVGVVSHVGELRSRITSQLVVRKTASGSSVAVSTPGAESAA